MVTPVDKARCSDWLLNVPLRSLKRSRRCRRADLGRCRSDLAHDSCTAGEIGCVRSPAWNSERKIGSDGAAAVCDVAATGVTLRWSGKLER